MKKLSIVLLMILVIQVLFLLFLTPGIGMAHNSHSVTEDVINIIPPANSLLGSVLLTFSLLALIMGLIWLFAIPFVLIKILHMSAKTVNQQKSLLRVLKSTEFKQDRMLRALKLIEFKQDCWAPKSDPEPIVDLVEELLIEEIDPIEETLETDHELGKERRKGEGDRRTALLSIVEPSKERRKGHADRRKKL